MSRQIGARCRAIAQNLIFGLFVGGIYGVAAAGLALVFGVLKLLNVAHGELLMFGGYISFWLFTLFGHRPVSLAADHDPAAVCGRAGAGSAVFRYVERLTGEARIKNSLLVSFGLALILQNLALQLFTADERSVQLSYSGAGLNAVRRRTALHAADQPADRARRSAGAASVPPPTYPGKAIRATAEDWRGRGPGRHRRPPHVPVHLGARRGAGRPGRRAGQRRLRHRADIGLSWTLKALVVIVLAGTGSVLGAFPAGLLLGLVEAISGMAFGAIYREVAGLVLFLLVLLLRPQGLFGRA